MNIIQTPTRQILEVVTDELDSGWGFALPVPTDFRPPLPSDIYQETVALINRVSGTSLEKILKGPPIGLEDSLFL